MLDKLDLRQGDWTEARIARLTTLWIEGRTCSQIATDLEGVSRNAVIGKVSRLKLNVQYPRPRPKSTRWTSPRIPKASAVPLLTRQQKAERQAERRLRKADGSLSPLVIIEPPQPIEFLNLTFDQLAHESCRYPRGENADMRYCGQPRMAGHSYCLHCYAITHYRAQVISDAENARRSAYWRKVLHFGADGQIDPRSFNVAIA